MEYTIISKKGNKNSYASFDMSVIVEKIKNGDYEPQLVSLREAYPRHRSGEKEIVRKELATYLDCVPKMILQADVRKCKGEPKVMDVTGLVVLQVNNLQTKESALQLREAVTRIPFTKITFIGATGFDLKIVCEYEFDKEADIKTKEKVFKSAYANLHYIYSTQLGICLDNSRPCLEAAVQVSSDNGIYYNPDATKFIVIDSNNIPDALSLPTTRVNDNLLDAETAEAWADVYEHCHSKAIEMATSSGCSRENYNDIVLSFLAQLCAKSGVPQELAVTRTLWKLRYRKNENLTRRVFQNEYEDNEKVVYPLAAFSKPELTARRTRDFINRTYFIRRNILSREVEFCRQNGYDFVFRPITDAMLNTMSQEARFAGVGSSRQKQDIIEYVQSDMVKIYNPITDWLEALPEWDGKDHVSELIGRIPSDSPNYEYHFHVWLLAMVAHWLGKDYQYGNAIVPLLIGDQGCGKSSFCASLLPEELRRYYNDNVSFRSEHDMNLNLSSFLLINIDEFDKLKKSEQPILKYLLSKSDVKGRVPYGLNIEVHQRFASFIATTNCRQPLTDPTGSRRFVCIEIKSGKTIRQDSDIDYKQLYAQLMHEINNGARYWFNDKENRQIMKQNAPYNKVQEDRNATSESLVELVARLFGKMSENDETEEMTLREIAIILRNKGADITLSIGDLRLVANALRANGFTSIRKTNGTYFRIKRM